MAGVEIVQSYEWWNKANSTNAKNNRHKTTEVDIRKLSLDELPKDIDIVVGSPPCVEFSFSNRGGSGDIEDGLTDIEKFLEVVEHIKPKFWAMENVPRVAPIITKELCKGGRLERFANLKPRICILDACEWGVPQQRKRCIAGNFDFDLLLNYRMHTKRRTLGNVLQALLQQKPIDPIYGIQLSAQELSDHNQEDFLSREEERMNREMKSFHPIYNNMAFPDSLDRPGRTVTATCTRVSRESIVIESPEKKGKYRRLTVRERACIQSFPITYQFYGESHSQKLKMVGNAVPPLLTFYIAQAMQGKHPSDLISPDEAISKFQAPSESPQKTHPDTRGENYPETRRFRAAIPLLRFKSGVRFEFTNVFDHKKASWRINFFYGNSKNIHEVPLNQPLQNRLKSDLRFESVVSNLEIALAPLINFFKKTDAIKLQSVWNRSTSETPHPYDIVDEIGIVVSKSLDVISGAKISTKEILLDALSSPDAQVGLSKILKSSDAVLTGLWVGSACNAILSSEDFAGPNQVLTFK